MNRPPVVLSIAGYDPSSGAGVTADIKTVAAYGCYAITCLTSLTVQSTQGVFDVRPVDPNIVSRTLDVLSKDFQIGAVRLGMLGSYAIAQVVADFLEGRRLRNVVLDPVMVSSSGAALTDDAVVGIICGRLLPLCDVITPNVDEAAGLTGLQPIRPEDIWENILPQLRRMAGQLHGLGSRTVVITGGHLSSANDYISYQTSGKVIEEVALANRIESRSTHGTGCAFAAAIACQLALGNGLLESIRAAKEYVRKTMLAAYPLGKGNGPLNHLIQPPK